MRLVQAAEHLVEHAAGGVHAIGCFDARAELVVDGLPVETARLDLPVLVADGGPYIFEGLNIELPLFRSERRY